MAARLAHKKKSRQLAPAATSIHLVLPPPQLMPSTFVMPSFLFCTEGANGKLVGQSSDALRTSANDREMEGAVAESTFYTPRPNMNSVGVSWFGCDRRNAQRWFSVIRRANGGHICAVPNISSKQHYVITGRRVTNTSGFVSPHEDARRINYGKALGSKCTR
jgi:hypothetical protein